MTETIGLHELTGRRVLNTAAVMATIPDTTYPWRDIGDTIDIMSIGIDGNTYTFVEDGNDGYRSYMGAVEVEPGLNSTKLTGASLINRDVWINYIERSAEYSGVCDIIQIVDMATSHIWAVLGTDNTDDYYPSCVMQWNAMDPEEYKNAKPFREMKEIPISAAQAVADVYGYDQVIIYARRVGVAPHPFGEHMTTYGTTAGHCAVAAKMGDVLKKHMQWDV